MFEKKHHAILPLRLFWRRLLKHVMFSGVIVLGALVVGMAGYHWVAGFSWIDSLLNASMILTGMGPVGELKTSAAKLFASAYALFSGLVFVTIMGITIAPVLHRFLHKFHMDEEAEQEDE